jgi:iron(III) transport system substrate-binding protein
MKTLASKIGACLFAATVSTPLFAQTLPSYYPADYSKLVEASKAEEGVLVYSVMSAQNWKPVLDSFKEKYPWIRVETLDLSNEIWSRYYSEKAAKSRTADLVISLGVGPWIEFVKKNDVAVYDSPESKHVPDWSKPFPGVYSVSADPVLIAWNSKILPDQKITSMAKVAELAADPKLKGKLTTYDAASGSVAAVFPWVWSQHHKEDGWAILNKVGPVSKPERSGGQMLSKLVTGEYAIAYLTSAITVLPKLNSPGVKGIIEWSFITDGQPLYARGMAVTTSAKSPNSAKLLLDHAISRQGQIGWGQGGMTPLRDDIAEGDVPFFTYKGIVKAVGGEKNVEVLRYDPGYDKAIEGYTEKWKKAYNR